MHIGFISTRFNGTDGVSLEVNKWSTVLHRMGHDLFYAAGELGGHASGSTLIPKLYFEHQSIIRISERTFGENAEEDGDKLCDDIRIMVDHNYDLAREFFSLEVLEIKLKKLLGNL
jgi:hypothetical protein